MPVKFQHRALATALICSLVVFAVNAVLPSWLNGFPQEGLNFDLSQLVKNDNAQLQFDYWTGRIDSGDLMQVELMRRRGFTAFQWLFMSLGMPAQMAFNLLNLLALIILLLFVGKTSNSTRVMIFAAFTLPIMLAYVGGVHSHSDTWQFAFLILSIYFLQKQHVIFAGCCFFASLWFRETSVLVLPMIIFLYARKDRTAWFSFAGATILFAVLYLIVNKSLLSDSILFLTETRHTGWKINFMNYTKTSESIGLLLAVLCLPLAMVEYSYRNGRLNRTERNIIYANILFHTIVVMIFTTAREARYHFLVLIPIFYFIRHEIDRLYSIFKHMTFKPIVLSICVASAGFLLYHSSLGGTGTVLRLYAALWYFVSTIYLLSLLQMDVHRTTE